MLSGVRLLEENWPLKYIRILDEKKLWSLCDVGVQYFHNNDNKDNFIIKRLLRLCVVQYSLI